jgi:formylglycine-generating enzyme required for sulfatase activity
MAFDAATGPECGASVDGECPCGCWSEGQCVAEGWRPVEDLCLMCVPAASREGLSPVPDGTKCRDGEPCSLPHRCVAGVCAAWGPTDCDDGQSCTHDRCDPTEGCRHDIVPGPCSDGDPCTVGDECDGPTCAPGAAIDCDDGDACTLDSCDVEGACTSQPARVDCSDGGPCWTSQCDPATGQCATVPITGPCDDGDDCTLADFCLAGACVPGLLPRCDDGHSCTTDSCIPGEDCQHEPDCCPDAGCPLGMECQQGGYCASEWEVFVPAGTFWRGSQVVKSHASPAHTVYLSAFVIDRVEVSVANYAECVDAGVCTPPIPPAWVDGWGATFGEPGLENYPVNYVDREQAAAYCSWRGQRLPTEAEWEKTARGGCETVPGDCTQTTPQWPWGDASPTCDLGVFDSFSLGGPGCGTNGPLPVGSKPDGASPYGALNLGGNVREWVADLYAADYYCKGPDATSQAGSCSEYTGDEWVTTPPWADPWPDPKGPEGGTTGVVRGGAFWWAQPMWQRFDMDLSPEADGAGLRCARDP